MQTETIRDAGSPTSGLSDNPYSARGIDTRFIVRSDIAVLEGYSYPRPVPDADICPYCGKKLLHWGALNPFARKTVIAWNTLPEPCDCAEYQADKKRRDEERATRKKMEEHNKIRAFLFDQSGMSARSAKSRTFDSFLEDEKNIRAKRICMNYAEKFSTLLPRREGGEIIPPQKIPNGMWIYGNPGTGKTHLAAAIANRLLDDEYGVICMTMIDLLAKIKASYNDYAAENEFDILEEYKTIPLLIIDDIGSEQPTEWGIAKIYEIVNARYEGYMPTIVTSNYGADGLAARMTVNGGDGCNAKKTIDRLREMCVELKMNWESRRGG